MIKFVYLIQSLENGYFKIGISKNPNKRLKQLQTGNSSELKLIDKYPTKHANIIEKSLQNYFSYSKKVGEWFEIKLIESFSFHEKCKKIEENIILLEKNGNNFI